MINESTIKFDRSTVILIVLTFLFYIITGFLHEAIFVSFKFDKFLFLTCVQLIIYFLLSLILMIHKSITVREEMFRDRNISIYRLALYYITYSVLIITSMTLTNKSLVKVDYSFKILSKSLKIIVTIIIGKLFFSKHYEYYDYLASLMITTGLIIVYIPGMGNVVEDDKYNILNNIDFSGLVIILIALFMDAMSVNFQELITFYYNRSLEELTMCYSTLGIIILLPNCMIFEITKLQLITIINNTNLILCIISYSIFSFLSLYCIGKLIQEIGSLPTIIISSVRRFVSLLISIMAFNKGFSSIYVMATLLIFGGTFLRIYYKYYS